MRKIVFNIIRSRHYQLGIILFTFLLFPLYLRANQKAPEYHIKAVFLYNLTHFVNWPEQTTPESHFFIIGIYGPDPFGSVLDLTIAKEKKYSRPFKIVRLDTPDDIPESCNILYVSSDAMDEWEMVRRRISGHPILSVSDDNDFTRNGGMVGLLKHDQRIKVEINHRQVKESGLSMSAKLLRLAVITE